MKLNRLRIKNFRCCRDVTVNIGSMHAIVGSNNAGKSTILRALDFFFNPSVTKLSDETFWAKNTSSEIRVEATFTDLTESEAKAFDECLRPDRTLLFARTAVLGSGADEEAAGEGDARVKVGHQFSKPQPIYEWLVTPLVSGAKIKEWVAKKDSLWANGKNFWEYLDSPKPAVEHWKSKATSFVTEHLTAADLGEVWTPNPAGYANVFKSMLPHFVLIPAVRDATDESKVLKTNPFGRLIHEIIGSLSSSLRDEMDTTLKSTMRKLNRIGGSERVEGVTTVENSIKSYLSELMAADLEIEFQAPTVDTLLTTPKLIIDDGFRGAVDGKGHGLQRAVIFSILRAYARFVTGRSVGDRRTLIFGVEEPELYMHPTAQRTIRSVLRSIANGGDQVMLTTHSPLLVDVCYFDEIVRVEAVSKEDGHQAGTARTYQLAMEAMIGDLVARRPNLAGSVSAESMREQYGHAYTPTRNEGFFARQVVLVEGQTESYCLPIFARALGFDFDTLGIAVIDCGGKGQIDRLYRIFNSLQIPCYVLFDFDKSNKDSQCRKASADLLQFLVGKKQAQPTAAVVTDRYAFFLENWEKDLRSDVPEYELMAAQASQHIGPGGKPLVARFAATKLTKREKPVVPPFIDRVIRAAVKVKAAPSCLQRAEPMLNLKPTAV